MQTHRELVPSDIIGPSPLVQDCPALDLREANPVLGWDIAEGFPPTVG